MINHTNDKLEPRAYKEFSANYSYTNHNFIIQNIDSYARKLEQSQKKYIPGIYIFKNILQRGKPTLMSIYLRNKLGLKPNYHKEPDFKQSTPLIDNSELSWKRTIKGGEEPDNNPAKDFYDNNPAKDFYDNLIPKYFEKHAFIKNLLIPEITFFDITQVENKKFYAQRVDFYLPQARLIIEIDGKQHEKELQVSTDKEREDYAKDNGIKTIRITTSDIKEKNELFKKKIAEIESHITDKINDDDERKNKDPTFIALGDYKAAYSANKSIFTDDYTLLSTAIIRMQLLILELLENGSLSLKRKWSFEIRTHDISGFAELAIEDTFRWLKHIYNLHNIPFKKPSPTIKYIEKDMDFNSGNDTIKIDFSLYKRCTDEFQTNTKILCVRTHYLDEYTICIDSDGKYLNPPQNTPYDFFTMSVAEPIKYEFKPEQRDSIEDSLIFFLQNIFLQDIDNVTFRDGQYNIIVNALEGHNTLGLLPTGAGKSICYQLPALLQPAISFVIPPIISLMRDQKQDLEDVYISRINYISSEMNPPEKSLVQNNFSKGKYFFILISPERLQKEDFRTYLGEVNKKKHLAYAVIDEAHCFSEWGHDFRTSYLNLSNVISDWAPNVKYIALTATASENVKLDIKNEFDIDNKDVKSLIDYSRDELTFDVKDITGIGKYKTLKSQLEKLNKKWGIFKPNGEESKCGIIFTPHVNGDLGCVNVARNLDKDFPCDVKYYSGKCPKLAKYANGVTHNEYKIEAQEEFKENKFTIMVATKSFGMGINKKNIYYTIHYALPSSVEALYQEAGRAGRDKNKLNNENEKAKCLILLSPKTNESILDKLEEKELSVEELKNIKDYGDIGTNLFLMNLGLHSINDDYELMRQLYNEYYDSKKLYDVYIYDVYINVPVPNSNSKKTMRVEINKTRVEQAIYKLSKLGIVDDWTVEDFINGKYKVQFKQHTAKDVHDKLIKTIQKYEKGFSIEKFANSDTKYAEDFKKLADKYTQIQKYFYVLLVWSHTHFVYNRRQSLKNVYENCFELSNGDITADEFKKRIENYFKTNETTDVLQIIADSPNVYQNWFKILYKEDDNNTNKLIDKSKISEIKDQLSRFLESYENNTGLNVISGIIRLLLNDYDDSDGRQRFEKGLKNIIEYEQNDIDIILNKIINIVIDTAKMDASINKYELVKSIHSVFKDIKIMRKFYDALQDEYSLSVILGFESKRLKGINTKIEEIEWQTA